MRLFLLFFLLLSPFAVCATENMLPGQQPQLADSSAETLPVFDLGRDQRRGVEAHVQLRPEPTSAAGEPLEANRQQYTILVSFIENGSGQQLLEGQVAARTFAVNAIEVSTVRLEPQLDTWTAVLLLSTEEETMIKIGSKLTDGKKRIYRFFFNPQPVLPTENMILPAE